MEFRDLEQFLAVFEHGSILGAAEVLGVAQPALSRRIRALEVDLGLSLFSRTTRGVVPTEYGELLAQHARLVLRDREHALEALSDRREGAIGRARVGVAPALAGLLPVAIDALSTEKPGITFTVVQGTYDSLAHALRQGEIDGAFTLLPPGESQEGFAVHALVDDPVRIVCNAEHSLARKRKIELKALVEERWVIMNRPHSILDAFHAFVAARGLSTSRVVVETDSLDFLKSLVLASGFLSVLPSGAVRAELTQKRMKALPIEGLPELPSGFLHRQEVLPTAVGLLLDEMRSLLQAGIR